MAETDAEFVERIERRWMIAAPEADIIRLFALARRGAAVQKAGWLAGRDAAAKLIEDHSLLHGSGPAELVPRREGDTHGLAYATAIRALPPPPERDTQP